MQQLLGQVETLKEHRVLPPQVYEAWVRECASVPTLEHLQSAEACLAVQRQLLKVHACSSEWGRVIRIWGVDGGKVEARPPGC